MSRLQRIRNEEIRRQMNGKETVIDRIEKKELTWFGHLKRMNQQRWNPDGRGLRGRPRRTWYEGIKQTMSARNLKEEDATDRERWRLGTERPQLQNP